MTTLTHSACSRASITSTKEYRINNVASGGTINFLQGANSRFYVNSAGRVGIGTTTPGAKLEIDGASSVWSTGGWGRAVELPNGGVVKWRTNGTTRFGIGQSFNGLYVITANGDDGSATPSYPMTILNNGMVGIGTSNPTRAKVEINGSTGVYLLGTFGLLSTNGATSGDANLAPIDGSLYASDAISARQFFAHSDERIKRIDGRSDPARDLATLNGIAVTDYGYIDTIGKGTTKEKKVIAQQVETVFPQAVKRNTDAIPDIYKPAVVKDGWTHLATDLKVGDRVKLIDKSNQATHEVLEVAEGRFRTDFKTGGEGVFVYGREVSDFRMVDYEAIAMLNVSATQELHRRLEAQATEMSKQAAEIAVLTLRMSLLLAEPAKPVTHATFAPTPAR